MKEYPTKMVMENIDCCLIIVLGCLVSCVFI